MWWETVGAPSPEPLREDARAHLADAAATLVLGPFAGREESQDLAPRAGSQRAEDDVDSVCLLGDGAVGHCGSGG